jgi:hypothetical protein
VHLAGLDVEAVYEDIGEIDAGSRAGHAHRDRPRGPDRRAVPPPVHHDGERLRHLSPSFHTRFRLCSADWGRHDQTTSMTSRTS